MSKQTKYGDIGTKIRHDRKELESVMVEGQPKTQVKHKSPVETYYNKKQIDSAQRAAGEAMYRYWKHGWEGFNSCEYREPTQGGGQISMSDRQVAAQQQFKRGINALKGDIDMISLIRKVCIDEIFIFALYRHWQPRKAAKAKLKEGLQKIAKVFHYA